VKQKIIYPHKPSEFECQAYLWYQLRLLGFDARGEVRTSGCRSFLDIVVFDDSQIPVRIIENKKSLVPKRIGQGHGTKRRANKAKRKRHEQLDKYRKLGVPIDLVIGLREANKYIENTRLNDSLPELWLIDEAGGQKRLSNPVPAHSRGMLLSKTGNLRSPVSKESASEKAL